MKEKWCSDVRDIGKTGRNVEAMWNFGKERWCSNVRHIGKSGRNVEAMWNFGSYHKKPVPDWIWRFPFNESRKPIPDESRFGDGVGEAQNGQESPDLGDRKIGGLQ